MDSKTQVVFRTKSKVVALKIQILPFLCLTRVNDLDQYKID